MSTTRKFAQHFLRCSRLPAGLRHLLTTQSLFRSRPLISAMSRPCIAHQGLLQQSSNSRLMSTSSSFDVINVQDEEDFKKRVIDSSFPVVVDFHATWCGPCKILGPRLESILSKEEGKVLMAKVDIDENPDLAMEFGVRSVPTVVGIKNGKVQNQFIGVKEEDQIGSFVEKLVVS